MSRAKKNEVTRLVELRKKTKSTFIQRFITKVILLFGADIPREVEIGENVGFAHNALGTVINSQTVIGDNVAIYHNVTIGRADIRENAPIKIIIEDGALICAGAKILTNDVLVVRKNSIVAANAVLLQSTEENSVYGGIPATCISRKN